MLIPKSEARKDTGKKSVATPMRKAELSVCVELLMLNSSSIRLLKPVLAW